MSSRRRLLVAAGGGNPLDKSLVFYAPLRDNFVDLISGREMTVTGSVSIDQAAARFIDGYDEAPWLRLDDPVLPVDQEPCTLAIWVCPTSFGVGGVGSGYCDFFGYGIESAGEARLVAANTEQLCGHLYERDYDASFLWDMSGDIWTHCAVTIEAWAVSVYANGTLLGTDDLYLETAAGPVILGAGLSGDGAPFVGRMKEARIYNRILSAEEIRKLAAMEA